MVSSRVGGVVVVDGRGAYTGTVDMGVIMAAAETMRSAALERSISPQPLAADDPRLDADESRRPR